MQILGHRRLKPAHRVAFVITGMTLLVAVPWGAQTQSNNRVPSVPVAAVLVPQLGHDGDVGSVAYSPDGKRIASASDDGTVRIWDTVTGEVTAVLAGHDYGVDSVTYSPDGTRLASVGSDYTVRIWDAGSGELKAALRGPERNVHSVAYSPDGKRVVSAGGDGTVRIWDAVTGEMMAALTGHEEYVLSVAYSPDGESIASASGDGTVRIWDVVTGDVTAVLNHPTRVVASVAYSPDGKRIVSAGDDEIVRIWDALNGELTAVLTGHNDSVNSVVYSPNGKQIASGSSDGTVRIWDAQTGTITAVLNGPGFIVHSVKYRPDGKRIASSVSANVAIWDAETGEMTAVLRGYGHVVTSVKYSPDGERIASGGRDNTVRVRDAETGEVTAVMTGHDRTVTTLAYSPEGTSIASGSADHTVRVWNADTGDVTAVLNFDTIVTSVAYSPDGTRIASGSADGIVRIWNMKTKEVVGELSGHSGWVKSLAYSPDGTRIASGGSEHARIWDAETGEVIAVLGGQDYRVNSLAYSPDGTRLASAGSGEALHVWDADTGKLVTALGARSSFMNSVAYSPLGKSIASSGFDGVVRIWDAETGDFKVILGDQGSEVHAVAYSPDGTHVISGGGAGTMDLWSVEGRRRELSFRDLPGFGWITYRPDRPEFAASADAERHVRIRLDGMNCPLFRFFHRGRYCPVYDLEPYRSLLRKEPEKLRTAVDTPVPEIRPRELREIWEYSSVATHVSFALVLSAALGVLLGCLRMVNRRRGDRLAITRTFFGATDYRVGSTLHRRTIVLRRSEGENRTDHYAVVGFNGRDEVDPVVERVAQRAKKSRGSQILYLIHPTTDSETRPKQLREARTIMATHRIDVVLLNLVSMKHAIDNNLCEAMLREAEDKYVTRIDPYREKAPIDDAHFFFGRTDQLKTIPPLLLQGQHVGIFGLRKTGKTSLANQLRLRFRDNPFVKISCQELDSNTADAYLAHITEALHKELNERRKVHDRLEIRGAADTRLRELVIDWHSSGGLEPIIIVLDEVETLMPVEHGGTHDTLVEGRKVLGVLRALAQELRGLVLLVIGYRPHINRMNQLPLDAGENPFFMGFQETFIGFLTEDESDAMIGELGAWRSIAWEPSALQRVYHYCGGHPYVTRLFASEVLRHDAGRTVTTDRVERAAKKVQETLVESTAVESTALELQSNMRRHEIGNMYSAIAQTLTAGETELLCRVVGSAQPVTESDITPEMDQALTSLEHLGLVDSSETISCSAALFEYWVRTRLVT